MRIAIESLVIVERTRRGVSLLREDLVGLRNSLSRVFEAATRPLIGVLSDREARPEYPKRDLTEVDRRLEELRRVKELDYTNFTGHDPRNCFSLN